MVARTEQMRALKSRDKASSKRLGAQRLAKSNRVCPVPGCVETSKDYSRYCPRHKERLGNAGHPTLHLATSSLEDWNEVLEKGREARQLLEASNNAERRAWGRIEAAIAATGKQNALNLPLVQLARNNRSWKNEHKANIVVGLRVKQLGPEVTLAAVLGQIVRILEGNQVPMNGAQLLHCFHKAAGKAVMRHMRRSEVEPLGGKKYHWVPSQGTYTKIGQVIEQAIAEELGKRWFKELEVRWITRDHIAP